MSFTNEEKAILRKWGAINPGGTGAYALSQVIADLIKETGPIKKWQVKLYRKYLKKLKTEKPKKSFKINLTPVKYPMRVWKEFKKG